MKFKKKFFKNLFIFLCIISIIFPNSGVLEAANVSNVKETPLSKGSSVKQSVYGSITENVYDGKSHEKSNRYLVRVKKNEMPERILTENSVANNKKGLTKVKRLKNTNILIADLTDLELTQLSNDKSIESIEPDSSVYVAGEWTSSTVNEVVYAMKDKSQTVPWGNHATGSYIALQEGYSGQGIKIAVLDTGISNHEDIRLNGGISFVEGGSYDKDDYGHGTLVAGTIAATDNQIGSVGGSPSAELYSVKVLDSNGDGSYSKVIEGIEWAIENGMNIISISFVGKQDSKALHEAIIRADQAGILVVAAAGNDGIGKDTILYPAHYSETISVGSIDRNFQRSNFSSTGSSLDVVAPGTLILSTTLNNKYSTASGTSMASAYVSANLATLWSQNKDWSSKEVRDKLIETTTPLGSSSEYGHGLVNVAKAMGIINTSVAPMYEDAGIYTIDIPKSKGKDDVTVASFDKVGDGQTIEVGDSATVSLKLDGDQNGNNPHSRINITVYPTSDPNNIVDSKSYSNPGLNTTIQYTWDTSSLTPTGTYTIRYSYPAYPDGSFDDKFQIYVTQATSNKDTFEPNDTTSSAYQIKTGNSYVSYISSSTDIDYYTFTPSISGTVNIRLTVPSDRDYELVVYDTGGNVLIVGREGVGVTENVNVTVDAGSKYYVVVSGYSGTYSKKPYTLIVGDVQNTLPSIPNGLVANAESNSIKLVWNAVQGATSYKVQIDGTEIKSTTNTYYDFTGLDPLTQYTLGVASINTGGSSDYAKLTAKTKPVALRLNIPEDMNLQAGSYQQYAFTPSNTGIYKFATGSFGGGTELNDTVMDLYTDENMTNLLETNDDANGSTFSEIKRVLISGVTYYVKIHEYKNANLHARIIVTSETSSIPFIQENIPVDVSTSSGTGGAVYQFIPLGDKEYKVSTGFFASNSSNGSYDTILEIFSDQQLTQRLPNGFNDDAGNSYFSEININLQTNNTYYIKLSGFQGRPVKASLSVIPSQQTNFVNLQNKVPVDVSTRSGEKGLFTYTPTQSGKYRFYTSPNTTGEQNDTEILLYSDSSLRNLISSNNNANGNQPYGPLFSKLEQVLSAGITYYVVVRNPNNYNNLNCRLAVEDSFHSDRSTAIPTDWNTIIGVIQSNSPDISSMYDTDYYSIEVTEPVQVHINITANSAVLEDSNGNFKGIFSAGKNDVVEIKNPGIYYIKVQYFPDSRDSTNKYNPRNFQKYYYSLEVTRGNVVYIHGNQTKSKMSLKSTFYGESDHIDAAPGKNDYVTVPYKFHNKYDRVIIEVHAKYNDAIIFREVVSNIEANQDYMFAWKGEVNQNRQYGLTYDFLFGQSIEHVYYARNGLYSILIYADDSKGKKYPRFFDNIAVFNDTSNQISMIDAPPMTLENGEKITSYNKEQCAEICKNYFTKYVLDFNGAGHPDLQYSAWLTDMYGPNGLEKFWYQTESFMLYDDSLSEIDNIQKMLNDIGMIPFIGEPADGLNGIIYLIRGQYDNAALSALSLIPVIGNTAAGAKIIKGVRTFKPIIDIASECTCFAAGTTVNTDQGKKSIEEIKIGDLVLSKNIETGEQGYKPVEMVYVNPALEIVKIKVGGTEISTTPTHPFWIQSKGWVAARDLTPGDQFESSDGSLHVLESIEFLKDDTTVYNLSVQDFHTFYASNIEILTHNASKCYTVSSYLLASKTKTKSTMKGSSNSKILAKELEAAGFIPDRSSITNWDAHHIVPATSKRGIASRDLLLKEFKIDINSVANGIWLPKKKGVTELELLDWDEVEVVVISTHNGGHTFKYYDYVENELRETYRLFGDLNEAELTQKGVQALSDIRQALMDGTLKIGLPK